MSVQTVLRGNERPKSIYSSVPNFLNMNPSEVLKFEFLKQCDREGLCQRRKDKYLFLFRHLEHAGINIETFEQKDIDNFFYIKNTIWSEWSKHSEWHVLKKFVRWLGKYKQKAFSFEGYRMRKPQVDVDILSIEELRSLIALAKNSRDKLLIMFLYESGCRIGELLNIKKDHVNFDANGCLVKLNGKTGIRVIRIINCSSLLKAFISLQTTDRVFSMNPGAVSMMLKRLVKRASITKRVYPHLFRHTRVTHLAKYLTEQEQRLYFGWSKDSDMPSTYAHLSDKDIDDKLVKLASIMTSIHTTPQRFNQL